MKQTLAEYLAQGGKITVCPPRLFREFDDVLEPLGELERSDAFPVTRRNVKREERGQVQEMRERQRRRSPRLKRLAAKRAAK